MKIILVLIGILIAVGIFFLCRALISMSISSRELLEYRNKLEKENKELKERMQNNDLSKNTLR